MEGSSEVRVRAQATHLYRRGPSLLNVLRCASDYSSIMIGTLHDGAGFEVGTAKVV